MNFNQKALMDLINSGGNPEIMVMNMLQQRAGNNKLFANLLQLAQAQDTQQIESIVKNIVNESGKNYEEEHQHKPLWYALRHRRGRLHTS